MIEGTQVRTIMLVDDTPESLKLMQSMLQSHGYRVVVFTRARLALEAARRRAPDLILLDVAMPEMDGFEMCRRLKECPTLQEIPVLFISALDDTASKVKALTAGGVDYIPKPIQEEEVLARVSGQLRLASLQSELKEYSTTLETRVEERTRQLASAHDQLLESGRLKDDFFMMISHELRTPASGLLGMGEFLIDACPMNNETKEYVEHFRRSGARLRALIEDATTLMDIEHRSASTETSLVVLLEDALTENRSFELVCDDKKIGWLCRYRKQGHGVSGAFRGFSNGSLLQCYG